MRNHSQLRPVLLAAALACPLLAAGPVQAASLFDAIGALFGADPEPQRGYRPAPGYYDGHGGLDLTVRPRKPKPRRERPVVRRPAPVAPTVTLNFDPATNPNWYLDDPTLRPGDIVVIKGEVLVFEGGGPAPHGREDFTSLAKSRLSPEEREKLRQMAGVTSAPREAPQKTATAASE